MLLHIKAVRKQHLVPKTRNTAIIHPRSGAYGSCKAVRAHHRLQGAAIRRSTERAFFLNHAK